MEQSKIIIKLRMRTAKATATAIGGNVMRTSTLLRASALGLYRSCKKMFTFHNYLQPNWPVK